MQFNSFKVFEMEKNSSLKTKKKENNYIVSLEKKIDDNDEFMWDDTC